MEFGFIVFISILFFVFFCIYFFNRRDWISVVHEAAKILNPEARLGKDCAEVEGAYKGRIINVRYYDAGSGQQVILKVIPLRVPREQKSFMVNYPKPTQHTTIRDGIISLDFIAFPSAVKCDDYTGEKGKMVIIKAFDDLTKAAEIVESDMNFYKGELGERKEMMSSGLEKRLDLDEFRQHKIRDLKKAAILLIFCLLCVAAIVIGVAKIFMSDTRWFF